MIALEQIAALPQTNCLTIPPDYLDEMGHMNIRWYIAIFDRAAWGAFALFGATFEAMQAHQVGVFALEQHIRYLAEVRVGETVAVHTRFLARSEKRLHFIHMMLNQDQNVLACTLESTAMNIDMTQRRSAPWLPEVAAKIDDYIQAHQQLAWEAPLCGTLKA